MADNVAPEEKTEAPTDKRIGELRKEGQIHLSTELAQVAALLAGFMAIKTTWQWLMTDMQEMIVRAYSAIAEARELDVNYAYDIVIGLMYQIGPDVVLITGSVAIVASLAVMLQTDWNVKEKKLQFRWDYLNPITGIKRVFSIQGVMNTLKAIVKLALILPIAYFGLKAFAPMMIQLIHTSVPSVLSFTGDACYTLFWRIMYVLIALAVFDYFWTKFQWLKHNRMTKEEVKDERKAIEGDEKTKRKIQSKGLSRIAQRIRQSVPQADVVVTNPTHIAVALKYDRDTMKAPKVLAKGQGFIAEKIKEIARESGVPVLERKPLARALFKSVDVGGEIPYDLFKAVAKVLAFVYRLKRPHRQAANSGSGL